MTAFATKPAADAPYALHGERIADLGYSVIPCRPGSKRPGDYKGGSWYGRFDWSQYCDRAPTEYELRTWTRWPDAGLCVALGFNDVIAVDVDTDDDAMRSALSAVLPLSTVQKRGEKGFTAFYRGSRAIQSRHFDIHKSRVVDLLAYGTQTVIPPTVHPDTQRPYVWLTDDTLENTHPHDLPQLPDDIADQIADALEPFGYFAPAHVTRVSDGLGGGIWRDLNTQALTKLDLWVPELDLPKLSRNRRGGYVAVPFWRPSHRGRPLHDRNPNLKISEQGIRDFHDGEKGYTPVDLVMSAMGCTFDFAANWLKQKIGVEEPGLLGLEPWFPKRPEPVADNDDIAPAPAQPVDVAAPRSSVNPFPPKSAGGLIEAISRWTLECGRRPVPEFAMMTAIAFAAGLYGRRFVGPTGVGLNVYLVGLGASALGKGHPLKALRTIANDCNMLHMVAAGVPTSDSAIERMLRKLPSQVLPLDEFGLLMQSVNGRNSSSWSQTVRRALLEVYSLSTDMWMGKQFSDPKRPDPEPLHCPTLTLMSVTTPTTFYDGLSEANLSDGFLNRMTVIHATEMPDRQEAEPIMTAPPSLVAAVKRAEEGARPSGFAGAAYRDPNQRPKMAAVPWASEEAKQRWLWIEDWQIAQIEERSGHEGIVGRAAEQTQKFATLRALSRDGKAARVTLDDVEWGYAIVQRSIDCLDRGIAEFMSGSEFEALTKAILSALKKSKDGTAARSTLLRAKGISKADGRQVTAALDRLVETGQVMRSGQTIRLLAS
ncbi:bifunctional DNA primase/polymerase [Bosea sp. FBZP-16]|uniref:bifunctional DNA primase/polymerase n=1 Tax=Bosea sp. FBZP-16 TaxID=2065382 RepID=UPI000C318E88|nr:bifunctional DNA primase/polymerase [Bosea sp. FBZP-16]